MAVSRREIKGFIDLVQGTLIGGDPVPGSRKAEFLRTGKRILKTLATEYLKLPPGTFDLRTNPAGPAVSGDVILHGEHVYVQFEQSAMTRCFLWRTCKERRDYTGGPNHWSQWDDLLDLEQFAEDILIELRFHHMPLVPPSMTAFRR